MNGQYPSPYDPGFPQAQPPPPPIDYSQSLLDNQSNSELILWMLDPASIIKDIKNQLRGVAITKEYDEKLKTYKDKPVRIAEALMNEQGINHLSYLLNLHLGKVGGTTILREQTIIEMTKQFGMDLTILLIEKWKHFGMDFSTITPIRHSLVRIVYMSFMRALNGRFLDALTKTYREISTHNTQNQVADGMPRKRGVLGHMFGWKV